MHPARHVRGRQTGRRHFQTASARLSSAKERLRMKSIPFFVVTLAVAGAACGQQTLAQFSWKELPGGAPRSTAALSLDGRDALKIESTNENGLRTALLTIEKPKISSTFYVLQGEVRYDGVQGDGFLEMWNYFPPNKPGEPESQYFSRTLGDSGEMGKI